MAARRAKAPAAPSRAAAAKAAAVTDRAWADAWDDHDFMTSQEAFDRVVVLPTPSLALDWCFGCNGLPLGRVHHLIGESGHRKSTLAKEFLRWGFQFDGRGVYIGTEGKDQPHLRKMAFRNDPEAIARVGGRPPRCAVYRADSIEAWSVMLTEVWDALRKTYGSPTVGPKKAKPGTARAAPADDEAPAAKAPKEPMWSVPIGQVVDSVIGTTTDRVFEKKHQHGVTQQEFGPEANLLNRESKTWHRYLDDTSMFLVLVNHDKPKTDKFGNLVHAYQGGKALRFYATLELVIARAGRYQEAGRSGHLYRMTPVKPSFAPDDGRSIVVPYYAWRDFTPKGPRDEGRWAWHVSTVRLFGDLAKSERFKPLYKVLCDVADVRVLSEKRCCCPKLGIPASSSVTHEELGRAIDSDPALRSQLQEIMGVQQFKVVEPGTVIGRLPPVSAEAYGRALGRLLRPDDVPGAVGVSLTGGEADGADDADGEVDEAPDAGAVDEAPDADEEAA